MGQNFGKRFGYIFFNYFFSFFDGSHWRPLLRKLMFFKINLKKRFVLVGSARIEHATKGLSVLCSTN